MPVYTGRNLTMTINSVAYSAQVTSATLTPTQATNQYITLTSSTAKQEPVTWSLSVENFQDWAVTTGVSKLLYDLAVTGTPIAFTLVIAAGTTRTASGNIVPVFGAIGGAATEVLSQSFEFPVDGALTLT
jgi:hypothetical protein